MLTLSLLMLMSLMSTQAAQVISHKADIRLFFVLMMVPEGKVDVITIHPEGDMDVGTVLWPST